MPPPPKKKKKFLVPPPKTVQRTDKGKCSRFFRSNSNNVIITLIIH